MPIVGVITPEAHAAVQTTRNRRIGLLATQATVTAGRYASLVHTLDAGVRFFPVACPRLVPLIESDEPFGEATVEAVREYAAPLKEAGVDTVILGCTHYPLIRPIFQRVFGRGVTLVFSAGGPRARWPRRWSARRSRTSTAARAPTASSPQETRSGFTLGERFQLPLGNVEQVTIAELEAAAHEPFERSPDGRAADAGDRARLHRAGQRFGADLVRQDEVLCTASPRRAPRWLMGGGRGWLTAEYSMLPASTGQRTQREASAGKQKGRTVEIQRLIGRALRAVAGPGGPRRAHALDRLRRPPGTAGLAVRRSRAPTSRRGARSTTSA